MGYSTNNSRFQHTIDDIYKALDYKLSQGRNQEPLFQQLSNFGGAESEIPSMIDKMYSHDFNESEE